VQQQEKTPRDIFTAVAVKRALALWDLLSFVHHKTVIRTRRFIDHFLLFRTSYL